MTQKKNALLLGFGIIIVLAVLFFALTKGGILPLSNSTADVDSILALEEDRILSLPQVDTVESQAGEVLLIYEDDEYLYYVEQNSKRVILVQMKPDDMERLGDEYSKSQDNTITEESAHQIMRYVIDSIFPEYNLDNLSINLDSDTGSHIEYYIYTIKEMHEDAVLNLATVSIAFNGEVTIVSGTHNTKESFGKIDGLSKEDAIRIAYEYVLEEKKSLDSEDPLEYAGDGEVLIATEDMVLPDGVNVGDEIHIEKLPRLEYFVDDVNDLHIIEMSKVSYLKRVVWQLAFSIDTSWGEIDEALNPIVVMYIDIETGEILMVDTAE